MLTIAVIRARVLIFIMFDPDLVYIFSILSRAAFLQDGWAFMELCRANNTYEVLDFPLCN